MTDVIHVVKSTCESFAEYQVKAGSTAVYPGQNGLIGTLYCTLGLTNEAGEVAGKIKKVLRDENCQFSDQRIQEISEELGDVLWYFAQLASELGLNLEEIARENLNKLADRAARGALKGSGDHR